MVEPVASIKPEFVKTTSPTPTMPAPPVSFDRMTPPALFATVRTPPSALIAVPSMPVASMTLPPPSLFTVPALNIYSGRSSADRSPLLNIDGHAAFGAGAPAVRVVLPDGCPGAIDGLTV